MPVLTLPKAPEEVLLDFYRIARRWNSHKIAVEERLKRDGIEIVEVPQPARRGCRLSDLLAYEAKMRAQLEQRCTKARRKIESKSFEVVK